MILDRMLPGRDGLDVLARAAPGEARRCRVIMLTARDRRSTTASPASTPAPSTT